VSRRLALLAALAASLVLAPAASAATFTVDDPADTGGGCAPDPDPGTCTLRQAIAGANAAAGADTIGFAAAVSSVSVGSTLTVTGPTTIDGAATVRWLGPAPPPLLAVIGPGAAGSILRGVTLQGAGGPGALLNVTANSVLVDRVSALGGAGNGIDVTGGADSVSVVDSLVTGNVGHGVRIAAGSTRVSVRRTRTYLNGGKPIALEGGANGGSAPVQGGQVGPRQADGTLPFSGSSAAGIIEVFEGNPYPGGFATSFLDAFEAPGGPFFHPFPVEPGAGATLASTVTPSAGTSEFALHSVPGDVTSPQIRKGRAVSTSRVIVQFTEPVDPSTIQRDDIVFEMADVKRNVTSIVPSSDGLSATISSNEGWEPGEAGLTRFNAVGVANDLSGNLVSAIPRVRITAGPGDFNKPRASRLKVKPKRFCVRLSRRCPRPGTTLTYRASEDGRMMIVVRKGKKRIGSLPFRNAEIGSNRVRVQGRLRGRALKPGRYRLEVWLEDDVGNEATKKPAATFNVRRSFGR
jgi:hypothetical protein